MICPECQNPPVNPRRTDFGTFCRDCLEKLVAREIREEFRLGKIKDGKKKAKPVNKFLHSGT